MSAGRKTQLWNNFTRMKDGNSARCKKCNTTIKCAGGSTSGLHNHLIRKHSINLLKRETVDIEAEESCNSKIISVSDDTNSRSKISNHFMKIKTIDNSFPAVLARLTARDCLSFKKICTSYDLQQLFKSKGCDIPKSPMTIKRIVMDYGDKIRQQTVIELSERTSRGELVTLTLDEWTSLKN